MYNKITLIGNLGQDPDLKQFEDGNAVCNFSLATNENYKDKSGEWQTKTEWHNIVIWGKGAEYASKSLTKGSLAFIEGKITTRKWQDKDGNYRYTTEVIASTFKSLDKREKQPEAAPAKPDDWIHPVDASSKDDLPF